MNSVFPIFSIVLLLLMINGYSHKGSIQGYIWLFGFHLLTTMAISTGLFINLGSLELSYSEFTLLIAFIVMLIQKRRIYCQSIDFIFYCSIIVAWFGMGLLSDSIRSVPTGIYWSTFTAVKPVFSNGYIKYLLRLVIFFSMLNAIKADIETDYIGRLSDAVFRMEVVLLGIVVFEWITKTMGNAVFEDLKRNLLGYVQSENWENADVFVRGGSVGLLGLSYEPSNFTFSQFVIGFLLISEGIKNGKSKYLIICVPLVLFILLSTSFSAVLYSGVLLGLFFISGRNRIKRSWIITGTLFLIGFVFFFFFNSLVGGSASSSTVTEMVQYYTGRWGKVVNSVEVGSGETEIRIIATLESLKVFLQAPIWGVGLGANYCYAIIPMALANMGIIGSGLWVAAFKAKFSTINLSRALVSLLVVMFCFVGNIGILYNFLLALLIFECRR